MKRLLPLMVLLAGSAVAQVPGGVQPGADYALVELDAAPFTGRASIGFAADGAVSGQAPCNRWVSRQLADPPGFALAAVAVTRMACADLAVEAIFLRRLSAMTAVMAIGDRLYLADGNGGGMVFALAPQP